jgi:GNAT superfamily N-acetyltransferase|tara:strand:+ start:1423 stop:2193 length:771 start_codon:yes stop_codon:yes gene_type:complete
MIQTLNKHVKWRKDNGAIFICDCKRLIDLKIPFKYESFMKKLSKGIDEKDLDKIEKKVFSDFERMKLLSELKIKHLSKKDFSKAIKILDNELGKERVRSNKFLFNKFKEFPQFFIGIFLDKEIIGVICGFPREDYLLISEISIDLKFHKRGFGKILIKKFEDVAKKEKYNKINVGAEDNAINFYSFLDYKPFLLVQYKKGDYVLENFSELNILKKSEDKNQKVLEVKVNDFNLNLLKKFRERYPKAWFQYIFTKSF